MGSAPLALPVALAVLAAAYLARCAFTDLRGWLLDRREARAAEASRTAPATAHGPAVLASLPLPVPALERDGEPLSEQEWADYIGCLFASNQAIPEPTYGADRD